MRKNYTSEFKAKAVIEILREAKSINEIAVERGVHVNQLGRWKKTAIEWLPQIFDDNRKRKNEQKEQEEKMGRVSKLLLEIKMEERKLPEIYD